MIIPNAFDLNHQNSLNVTEVAAAGMWAMLHKVSQGTGFRDPAYTMRVAGARDLGLLIAGYDFATGDKVVNNVTNYLKWANLQATDAVVLDFEDNTQSEMTSDEAYEWLDRVMQATGRAAMLYGGNRITDNDPITKRPRIDPQNKNWIDMAKIVRLWRCRYIKAVPADNAALFKAIPPIPPWTENFGIQYTGDGIGPGPHTVKGLENGADLNVFMPGANRAQLAAAWAGAAYTGAIA